MAEPESAAPVAGEEIPADEAASIALLVKTIEDHVREGARTGPAIRDAHPKAHGCVKARFEVPEDLPADLKVGLFAKAGAYDAWIRFSNGSGTLQKDSIGDGRGMAIKVMNVAGSASTTQDFVMINQRVFFVRNAADYVVLQQSPLKFFVPGLNPFAWRFHELFVALSIAGQSVRNPLNIRYWSMSPFLYGDRACKFSARPAGPLSPFTEKADADFMRTNLVRHLAAKGATFELMVQMRTRPEKMPIEDVSIVWNETDAPFRPVATITIPPQTFDTPAQHGFGDNLSFTPWHCLPEHRPLGGINRVRGAVYEAISRLRHALNSQVRAEPTDFSI